MIITLQNHCKSPPFASNTDYTTKEVNCLGAIPPTTLEVGESLLNHVEKIDTTKCPKKYRAALRREQDEQTKS